ncbi:unnamed protein product [Dicrocoelium dendriticum]|nr:unnamed protein product [Dicrocoelium dendriticum]
MACITFTGLFLLLKLAAGMQDSAYTYCYGGPDTEVKSLQIQHCEGSYGVFGSHGLGEIEIKFEEKQQLNEIRVLLTAEASGVPFVIFDLDRDCSNWELTECVISKHGDEYRIRHEFIVTKEMHAHMHTLKWRILSNDVLILCVRFYFQGFVCPG